MNVRSLGGLFFTLLLIAAVGLPAGVGWLPHLLPVVFTVAAVLFLRVRADALGLIDRPSGHKAHDVDVPVVGGLAMYAALVVTLPLAGLPADTVGAVLVAGGLLVVVGALDDRSHLPVSVRFAAQVGAALIMIHWGDVALIDLGPLVGEETLHLGRWSTLMTVVATVGVINSLNMADGMDGLAGTLALTTLLVTTKFAGGAHPDVAIIAVAVCSALAGFLAFNAPLPGRAPESRVFMGDAGSMLIGLLIAWMLIDFSQGPERVFQPVTALWLFALPLLDTLTVMTRRLLRGRSPFAPDREHLHHILVGAGFSNLGVVGVALVLALGFAALGLLLHFLAVPDRWQFAGTLAVFAGFYMLLRHAWRVQRALKR